MFLTPMFAETGSSLHKRGSNRDFEEGDIPEAPSSHKVSPLTGLNLHPFSQPFSILAFVLIRDVDLLLFICVAVQ